MQRQQLVVAGDALDGPQIARVVLIVIVERSEHLGADALDVPHMEVLMGHEAQELQVGALRHALRVALTARAAITHGERIGGQDGGGAMLQAASPARMHQRDEGVIFVGQGGAKQGCVGLHRARDVLEQRVDGDLRLCAAEHRAVRHAGRLERAPGDVARLLVAKLLGTDSSRTVVLASQSASNLLATTSGSSNRPWTTVT